MSHAPDAPRHLSIIIPVFNEQRTIGRVLRRLASARIPIPYEVILVDDRSTDRTAAVVQELQREQKDRRMILLRNRTNKGKGACVRQGIKHSRADLVLIQDGDLEYDPHDIPRLLTAFLHQPARVVYGSRFLRRGYPPGMAWPNYVANRLLTWLTNRLYRTQLSDMETCYKLIPRALLLALALRASRFELEPEVTAKLAKRQVSITEVPIGYHGRTRRQGKKIRGRDFFIAVWTLLRYWIQAPLDRRPMQRPRPLRKRFRHARRPVHLQRL